VRFRRLVKLYLYGVLLALLTVCGMFQSTR
jgi:hypothetical protein